jgi:HEAT repeat protein
MLMVMPVGQINGVMMLRVIGVLSAAVLFSGDGGTVRAAAKTHERAGAEAPTIDVTALLTAARGAPPLICAFAAQSVRGYGWGNWNDAPSTPLAAVVAMPDRDAGNTPFPPADVDRLFEGLASADPCVRELSVRLLGGQKSESIASAFVARLGSSDPSTREAAAFGLGLSQPASAVSPLIQALRDATPGVRANSAWALGRIDDGRALAPLLGLFRDESEKVRLAAVVATGRLDSTSAVAALMRVVQQDPAPSVRRSAAWALGQLESREAADVLAGVLSRDSDAHVREMAAWALGHMEGRAGKAALANALSKDADERVRETAAWSLAQIEDRSAVDALAAATSDGSARVRGTVAWAIGQLRGDDDGSRVPPGLLRLLKDESEDVRLKAAWSLGQIGDGSALGAIQDALKQEQSSQVRRALVRALIKSGGRSEQAMTELLSSSDPKVREAAVRGLAGHNSFNPWPWPWPRPRPMP